MLRRSKWFQEVLGLSSGHGGRHYEALLDGSQVVAQLHHWDADEHPHLGDPADESRGNGVLLWFSTDVFDERVNSVQSAGAHVLEGPLQNPLSQQREIWLSGPEGYTVVVSGP